MSVRHATLEDLAALLKDQHARKVDIVTPATNITAENGRLRIAGAEPEITDDGVTDTDGIYLPTSVCDDGISEKLGIHRTYLRRMREERTDLWDANVNGWLHGRGWVVEEFEDGHITEFDPVRGDQRSFLVRCFRADEGEGVARAFLSDRYRIMDNLDVLLASLQGIEDAGVGVSISDCDLSDKRMYVKVTAPEVTVRAEEFLKGYRNPFGEDFDRWRTIADREGLGYGGEEPLVEAGFVISNSEVGAGAFSITPRAVIRICKNGLTIKADMMRDVHLGGKLDEGTVDWSADTMEKAIVLVRAKTRDAVRTFLSEEYLAEIVGRLEERSSEPVTDVAHVKRLTSSLAFSGAEVDGILNRFVQGGQMTRGGVVNAITAHAQTVDDADTAHKLEEQAVSLLGV